MAKKTKGPSLNLNLIIVAAIVFSLIVLIIYCVYSSSVKEGNENENNTLKKIRNQVEKQQMIVNRWRKNIHYQEKRIETLTENREMEKDDKKKERITDEIRKRSSIIGDLKRNIVKKENKRMKLIDKYNKLYEQTNQQEHINNTDNTKPNLIYDGVVKWKEGDPPRNIDYQTDDNVSFYNE